MKKKSSCLGRMIKSIVLVAFFFLLVMVGMFGGDNEKTTSTTSTPTKAVVATAAPAKIATEKPTVEPTAVPTEEPLEFTLMYSVRGAYGQYYTMNKNVEKATYEDKETFIQYFVPPGDYTVTNNSKYPTFVYIYSGEHIITDAGWEEPADGWVSEMLKPGDSCEITVNEGYYLELHDNDNFKLVQK